MTRPVRPIALVILTACMIYPGITLLFQGLYPFVTGEYFMQVGQVSWLMQMTTKMGLPPILPLAVTVGVGGAWVLGVLGMWAGDGRAYPLVLLGALGSFLFPVGPIVMGVIGLIAALGFRENAQEVAA